MIIDHFHMTSHLLCWRPNIICWQPSLVSLTNPVGVDLFSFVARLTLSFVPIYLAGGHMSENTVFKNNY